MKNKKFIGFIVFLLLCAVAVGGYFGIKSIIDSIPVYTVADSLPDGEGKKATVILLAGQSNASGCSIDEYLKSNVSPEKYAEYEAGYDNVYINYYASGANRSDEFVKCSVRQGEAGGYFGPELGLAERLHESYPDRMFFIIKFAWGGTSLSEKWLSPSSIGKTGTLYKHFISYTRASMEYLISKNYDVEIEGMCWMQGESDSFSVEDGTKYESRLKACLFDVRLALRKYAGKDGIGFVDAYIADNPIFWVYCQLVNQSKTKVAESSDLNVIIETRDLITTTEPYDTPDVPHYDSMSEIELGRRFADALSVFIND